LLLLELFLFVVFRRFSEENYERNPRDPCEFGTPLPDLLPAASNLRGRTRSLSTDEVPTERESEDYRPGKLRIEKNEFFGYLLLLLHCVFWTKGLMWYQPDISFHGDKLFELNRTVSCFESNCGSQNCQDGLFRSKCQNSSLVSSWLALNI